MTNECLTQLAEIASRIRSMRVNLPEVNNTDLAQLHHELAKIDLGDVKDDEVAHLQESISLLAGEINQTLERLNQYCEEMRTNLSEIEQHSTGVKAYAVTQNSR